MSKRRLLAIAVIVAMTLTLLPAMAAAVTWDGSKPWTGQGSDNDPACDKLGDGPYRTVDGWIHWILTNAEDVTSGRLALDGSGGGYTVDFPSDRARKTGHTIHWFTTYFDLGGLTATVYYMGTLDDNSQFTISDYCPGNFEELTVTKTAVTSYTRTHEWDIDKKVETENGYELDGYAKIWLYVDGHGNETATWTVDVTYEGYQDSAHRVSGTITVENTGALDAVITSVVDQLAGTTISVTWTASVSFPYTLPVGETITGTYSEVGYVEGINEVTVTTERDTYTDDAAIVWGGPTTEVNKTITVEDTSDLFETVTLGTVTAPNNAKFTYTKSFAWIDYGAAGHYEYDNTATIVETGQDASAKLLVNVQGFVYETAYAKGSPGLFTCFSEGGFSQWGWTNLIGPGYSGTWDLWAGAAKCDTSKGTLVGSVSVAYEDGHVTVEYNVGLPYALAETHVYAGTTMFPKQLAGKRLVNTVAPGQYTNVGPFTGPVYVIAHAVVGMPDPNFGPTP